MKDAAFLRSINIQLDVEYPERFAHFRPTSKSARLIGSVLEGDRGNALVVVAPYGSGKSISAGYLGQLVENQNRASGVLREAEHRMVEAAPELAERIADRKSGAVRGLFVPLYGYLPSAPAGIRDGILDAMRRTALGRQARSVERVEASNARDVALILDTCLEKIETSGRDRLVIVWDEFGRHLQGLISAGRPDELDVLQVLAEVASRSSDVPVSLVLLLHRSLLGYAAGLPLGLRREWAKIEGRFETLQYLDDSTEVYDLIGSLVSESRTTDPPSVDFADLAARAAELGLLPGVTAGRLPSILASVYPLTPATLYLLPRVAARVAQNERTLFSFLQWTSLDVAVTPGALYDFFRGDFRTDGGAGGTQRPWLETESALGKVPGDSPEAEVLKSAFLLGLGLSGERGHATRAQLAFALVGSGMDSEAAEGAIGRLIQSNLLVHRRHSDQVVVWHGTDVDLRGRLEDEKKRSHRDFDLVGFLSQEAPPPVWRPVEYNARRGIRRYLETEYTTVEGLRAFWNQIELAGWLPGTDGRVLHVLPENEKEFDGAVELARGIVDQRLFLAVARDVASLRDAAADLWCLLRMHSDQDMIGRDPLVLAELGHLTDDARAALQPLLDRVLRPRPDGSHWYHRGVRVNVSSVAQLRRLVSRTMEDVFPLTPEIDSEMVVRRSPSPVIVNARRKVVLALLERYGQESLGIDGHFADMAIFRSVFLRTGLYRKKNGGWVLAGSEDLEGKGLTAVWQQIGDFFSNPGERKGLGRLLDMLKEPPYGVREGLLPLLLAAGLKAFPVAATVRHRERFVDDLLPSVIEDMVKNASDYSVDVVSLSDAEIAYLSGMLELFTAESRIAAAEEKNELFRACLEAVMAWRHSLPESVTRSRYVTEEARVLVKSLTTNDPVELFLTRLPRLSKIGGGGGRRLSR